MIAVDEALRRLEVSAPERNAILEAFRYADARNAASLAAAIHAAQQEASQEADNARSQQAAPLLTSKPFTRQVHCYAAMFCSPVHRLADCIGHSMSARGVACGLHPLSSFWHRCSNERKEKSTLGVMTVSVMMGASVPRSSPRRWVFMMMLLMSWS